MRHRAGILSAMGAALAALTLMTAAPARRGRLRRLQAGKRGPASPTRRNAPTRARRPVLHPGGRPPAVGLTDFVVKPHQRPAATGGARRDSVKDVRVDLPEGLNVNPQAVPQCAKATFEANARRLRRQPGRDQHRHLDLDRACRRHCRFTVYNLVPRQRHPGSLRLQRQRAARCSIAERLPGRRRRLEQRLPRGLHDQQRPQTRCRWSRTGSSSTATKGGTFLTMGSQCNGPRRPASRSTPRAAGRTRPPRARLRLGPSRPADIDGCQSVPFAPDGRRAPPNRR